MKACYDQKQKVVDRRFNVGDLVLAFLPVPGSPLRNSFIGPCAVVDKVGDTNHVIAIPDRKKGTQLCHVNMLKACHPRAGNADKGVTMNLSHGKPEGDEGSGSRTNSDFEITVHPIKLQNSDVLNNLAYRLDHLSSSQRDELLNLVYEFRDLFPDVHNKAVGITHDVDVGQADPIKQHPYRVGPEKKRIIDQEIKYMLENKIINLVLVNGHLRAY